MFQHPPKHQPGTRQGAPRRTVGKGEGQLTAGDDSSPAQAPPSRSGSAWLEAGPRQGRKARTGSQEAGPRLNAEIDPIDPRVRLSPNPAPLVPSLGGSGAPGWTFAEESTSHVVALFAVAQVLEAEFPGGTQDAQAALPVRRYRAGTRCHRGGGPGTRGAGAPPAVPWSPWRGPRGVSGKTPPWKRWLPPALTAVAPRRRPAGGLGRAPHETGLCRGRRRGFGASARPPSWSALNGSACAGGGGVICECAACLGWGWFALPPPPTPLQLLLLPSRVSPAEAGSADIQPPLQRQRCALRETRAGLCAGFYLFILF